MTSQAEKSLCGCVSVLDDKGALEFNSEDVAALLTLALGRVHPFMPLAARITAAAEEAGWDGGADEEDDGDEETLDARVWAAVQQYVLECRAAAPAPASHGAAAAIARTPPPAHLFSSPASSGAMPPPPPPSTRSVRKAGRPADVDDVASPRTRSSAEERKDREGDDSTVAEVAASVAAPTSPTTTTGLAEGDTPTAAATAAAVAEVELTVEEAADLLEFVAAARFIAQLIAEPVVAAGVSAGRWSCAMRLAEQVRKLAEEEKQAQQVAPTAAPTLSLSNMLCLGALADVQGLGLIMAQQARYAPALEAVLKRELRQALRRGQGLKRRIKHRLQPGAPDVFAFPMIMPACQLVHHG